MFYIIYEIENCRSSKTINCNNTDVHWYSNVMQPTSFQKKYIKKNNEN